MLRLLQLFLTLVAVVLLQVSIIPSFIDPAIKPNLTVIVVCYLALRGRDAVPCAIAAYLCGLLNGIFSGYAFGLSGVSCLGIFLLLRKVSDQLYTESDHLMVIAVFAAAVAEPLADMFLTALFSTGSGIYGTVFKGVLPQALATAAVALMVFPGMSYYRRRSVS